MTTTRKVGRASRFAARLRRFERDRSGLALIEFAISLPVVMALGCYGAETANLVLMNERINQIGLSLADNASRVGNMQSDNSSQLREIDINDALTSARIQGSRWNVTQNGRITLSSLEEHDGKQYIRWQRCLGLKKGANYDSHYGFATADSGIQPWPAAPGTQVTGMGDANAVVTAPPGSGVMFVEINYDYQPIIGATWVPSTTMLMHYNSVFVVRDKRAFSQIFNPSPEATRYTCDRYTAT
ncbi:TadE/TadG family type IV pilus assembly protein [Sphingomonas sp. Mn802worker]|uniref:TadE/TadG family type IV pilus assembly protein n=1 Tax=Sphingomonas sp. Mn802worker TaxID=629773 RepID=UPI00039AA917|nr:hypothetical protein [Sphingomonas sp. Mn802worker]